MKLSITFFSINYPLRTLIQPCSFIFYASLTLEKNKNLRKKERKGENSIYLLEMNNKLKTIINDAFLLRSMFE